MNEELKKRLSTDEPAAREASNAISDDTGQLDVRFVLWRQFCAEYGVPIETLPSELDEEKRRRWEKMKEEHLK
ncbi:hypothetical protein [Pyrinomonas methylaliphatogenes]|uniref:hypothetical protein n=1 Tax=Pyrinomonas methylaliphatogenes TaxID=454194 RepID=UPI0005AA5035|nr:hypothetical protein [Pyrinomonas methylaliphatogenes]MBX5478935.1 hypothetical protein [Pyrinomonas methylaliphatogenes]